MDTDGENARVWNKQGEAFAVAVSPQIGHDNAAAPHPRPAPPLSYRNPADRPSHRRRFWRWASFAILILALTLAVASFYSGRDSPRGFAIFALLVLTPVYIGARLAATEKANDWWMWWSTYVLSAVALFIPFAWLWIWLLAKIAPWDWDFNRRDRTLACATVSFLSLLAAIAHLRCDLRDEIPS